MKGIYIIGQTGRTGTNFLFKLLLEHKKIVKSEHPGEDRLLMNIDKIDKYLENTTGEWNEIWKGMDKVKFNTKLNKEFQNCFSRFLGVDDSSSDKYILTKSPSTKGIKHFHKYFPDFKPIILIRDGRNVTESLVQSFNSTYSNAMKTWAKSGQRILAELSNGNSDRFLLIRYEELQQNTKQEIRKILSYLNLEEQDYNFSGLEQLPVTGSSQSSSEKGKVDWGKSLDKKVFNPNERFKNWSIVTKLKYNSICGKTAKQLGYKTFS